MMKRWSPLPLLFLLLFLGSCSDDEDENAPNLSESSRSKVTLLVSVNGLGDHGYNDCIARGVMTFAQSYSTDLSLLYPDDEEEARMMLNNWIENEGVGDSSVLIVNNTYESLIEEEKLANLGTGSRVLIVDGQRTSLPANVYNLRICRYGTSYLIGTMVQEFDALVLMAMPNYANIDEARNGFLAGYEKYKHAQVDSRTIYIADDEKGFANPDQAHHLMEDYADDDFIFPLAGGSVSGVIHYLNNNFFSMALMVGMDTDQSAKSSRVPFSMVVHIDRLLMDYLEDWKRGGDWQQQAVFGMEEQAIEVVMNDSFGDDLNVLDPRCYIEAFEDYFQSYFHEAKSVEADYMIKTFER